MSGTKHKLFGAAFKAKVGPETIHGLKTAYQIAQEHGVHPWLVGKVEDEDSEAGKYYRVYPADEKRGKVNKHMQSDKLETMQNDFLGSRVAVVIPSYKVTRHILGVISQIPAEVWRIYIIDDACPDNSGKLVEAQVKDSRVRVLYHTQNQGVGGAVMSGYLAAIADGAEIIVKIDGDGQMDAKLIPSFIEPIFVGEADYTKGNRFFDLEQVRSMPKIRLLGNAVLSFMTKLSSGYWDLFDPTNGYTAIHANVARHLPFEKISRRFFFETDMLFRLNTLRAVVIDVPMDANYGEEISNLKISKIVGEFIFKHVRNFLKRIFYNYYLRDMSIASIELPFGILLFVSGCLFGAYHWINSLQESVTTPAGTVMLAALPILMGVQLILAFLGYDIANVPRRPLHKFRRR